MYKRSARIIFLGNQQLRDWANKACAHYGSHWLESKEATLTSLDWADLVITLDADALKNLPELPRQTRHKHWPLDHENEKTVTQKVLGMIGGMKMLARLDENS